ncbi:MAG: hypothetical protein K2K97_08410, partial [Muribaculaceae bacterium]|nr:hypothetical protein [Muribaculaceae bacterium]
MKKIVFIADRLSQPRVLKRIISLHNAEFNVKVYGYDRIGYQCNGLPAEIKSICLGEFKDGCDYFQKIKKIKKDILNIINTEGHKDTI